MKKNETFKEVVVGVFMVSVLALLGYFTIVISGADVFSGRDRMEFSVAFDQVGGLKDHDSVMYRGTKVGKVERVEVTPTNLIVHVEVDSSVVLRSGCRIEVCNLSMLGGNYLLLGEGEGEVIAVEGALLRGEPPSDWMRDVSTVAKNLKAITGMAEIREAVTNFASASARVGSLADSARAVVDRVERGEGALGKLVSADDGLYEDIRRAVSSAADVAERVNRGEGTLGRLLAKDDELYSELKSAVAAFRKSCESFEVSALKTDAQKLVADARQLMSSLNAVAGRIERGEGTIGRLTSESELYDEVKSLVKDVRQVIDNYRDTTPISTFSSLLLGGF
jgi:phospholipid/cholesterol/gamma-HCH transport system substrate-binding protein